MKKSSKPVIVLMLIKWGALVVDGRGKLGGHVAAQNGGGSYLRTKVTPTNPQTTYQSFVRSLFGAISARWSGLSFIAILAWNNAVDEWKQTNIFGDLKKPSGKALFQRLNQQAMVAGYPKIDLPPAKLEMVSGIITQSAISTIAEAIAFQGAYTGANARVIVYSSGPVSLGTTFVKNLMRQFHTDLSSTYDGETVYQDYIARFGAPVPGQKVFFGVKYVLPTGQASPLQILPAFVV